MFAGYLAEPVFHQLITRYRNYLCSEKCTFDPSGNYYASALMADKFTDAYFVAGALDHFDIDLNGEPKQNTYDGEVGTVAGMMTYIFQQAR